MTEVSDALWAAECAFNDAYDGGDKFPTRNALKAAIDAYMAECTRTGTSADVAHSEQANVSEREQDGPTPPIMRAILAAAEEIEHRLNVPPHRVKAQRDICLHRARAIVSHARFELSRSQDTGKLENLGNYAQVPTFYNISADSAAKNAPFPASEDVSLTDEFHAAAVWIDQIIQGGTAADLLNHAAHLRDLFLVAEIAVRRRDNRIDVLERFVASHKQERADETANQPQKDA